MIICLIETSVPLSINPAHRVLCMHTILYSVVQNLGLHNE